MSDRLKQGLVQVYTGKGKGKTTAALGLVYRAIGHEFRVCFIQFMKGNSYCGELLTSQRLKPYIDFFQFGKGNPYSGMIRSGFMENRNYGDCFFKNKNKEDQKKEKEYAQMAYEFAGKVLKKEEYDIIVLDEIGIAMKYELVTVQEVLELIKQKPEKMELVLTGRNMPLEIIEVADLVSEIKAVKHPHEQGITARRGIEY